MREVVCVTLEETPSGAHTEYTDLTAHLGTSDLGTSVPAVARIWGDHGLKPHRVESFKLSNDLHFVEKLADIVGLYLDPPEYARVLCCDEKTQIQALDRTQPGQPLKRGRGATVVPRVLTRPISPCSHRGRRATTKGAGPRWPRPFFVGSRATSGRSARHAQHHYVHPFSPPTARLLRY